MTAHHSAWLSAHPERTAEWLLARLADGFDVHHINGDHEDNAPSNLVLIECGDHMMLHSGHRLRRVVGANAGKRKKKLVVSRRDRRTSRLRKTIAELDAQLGIRALRFAP